MQRRLGCMRGTGPRTTGAGARFFRSAGVYPPQSRPHPGHPAADARDIKVLADLFCLLRRRSIDIQVRWTWCRVLVAAVARGPVSRALFCCLKQDGQNLQDLQDELQVR